LWAVLSAIVVVAACASPRERLYTLVKPEPPPALHSPTLHIVLGPVTLPEAIDRPQLVIRASSAQLVALEQERWAEPVREAVPRVLAESVARQLPSASVVSSSSPVPIAPDLRVVVDVRRFEAIPGQVVIAEAHWWLRFGARTTVPEGTSASKKQLHGDPTDYESLVAAEAAALEEIGADLAAAIEKELAQKPAD
jgi:uncharacterized lipoprotein YmbA